MVRLQSLKGINLRGVPNFECGVSQELVVPEGAFEVVVERNHTRGD